MQIIPIVTVTCYRDLPLLELQAQSISLYLDPQCPVYIIVNEDNPFDWMNYFDQHIRHYYSKHKLVLMHRSNFNIPYNMWVPSKVNPWHVGWETQQILKLVVSEYIQEKGYLVLDSQNFLIAKWNAEDYQVIDDKVPNRVGINVMPAEIWDQYARELNVNASNIDQDEVSMCTPIFLNTPACKKLVDLKGGILEFSKWFKYASRIKSEFILYRVWLESLGPIDNFHYKTDSWAGPYMRDSRDTFVDNVNHFVGTLGEHAPHKWVSINHRSWGELNSDQYAIVKTALEKYKLYPKFDEYRANYVDIVF